jgi:hypothetical protein
MSEKKPNNSQTVALLGVGTAAAIGVAVWSISSALAPRLVYRTTPLVVPTPTTGASSNTGGASRDGATSGALPGSAADISSRTGGSVAAPISQGPGSRPTVTSEAVLAPEADPFVPLPTDSVVIQPPRGTGQTSVDRSLSGHGTITGRGIAVLPTQYPTLGGSIPSNRGTIPPFVTPPPPAPELVGTLLGEQPSAVFRGGSQLVAVPVGASFGGWKVVDVGQGVAVIKGMGRMVHLQVGVPTDSANLIPTGSLHTEGASATIHQPPTISHALVPTAHLQPEAISQEPPATSNQSASGIFGGDVTRDSSPSPDDAALPALPDTPLTPHGKAVMLPDGSAIRGDSGSAPIHPEAAPRTALDSGMAPFRRLIALNSTPGPLLPGRGEIHIAAAHTPTARTQATHRRVRHHPHRHGHRHHRYTHRRPVHQKRYMA